VTLVDPSVVALAGAVAIDALLGEPPARLHPVVWIGGCARWLIARAPARGRIAQLVFGAAVALLVPAAFAALAALALAYAPPPLDALVAIGLLTSTFAARALGEAADAVRRPLADGDLATARRALRSLCSRDPSTLDATEVAAGAVESVAENASDSVVAPLFYYALFGLPGAVAYRAINTLDAMIGYRGRYEYLGKAAARLDDLANLVPARLTAMLLLGAGVLRRDPVARGWAILRRDGATTPSPNAGRPMAVVAGLLAVRLEKPGHYRLGDPLRPVEAATIDDAWHLVTLVFIAAALLCAAAILVH